MERTAKTMKTKGKKRTKTSIQSNKQSYFSELPKLRPKNTRKTNENKLMVQLHHFANLTKSTTATKASTLNLSGESKALLENDYFKVINSKNTEFVAKPFVINKISETNTDFCPKIRCSVANTNTSKNKNKENNYAKKEFKDLVAKKLKAKECIQKNPFAVACRDINSMLNIKNYQRVFCKKIFETRLFINGILVYDSLKQHYSGVPVARNCFKKKFINKLEQATKEIFPEMESFKVTSNEKENRLLQNVIEYYESQENDINMFNEQMVQIPNINEQNDNNEVELSLECHENINDRPITPDNEEFSPDSFTTPPSQRLIPVDLSATTVSKYQTGFYEKDAKSGKATLFEFPEKNEVTGTNVDKINRTCLKRIDVNDDNIVNIASCSNDKINDLDLVTAPGTSPTLRKAKRCPKKRLFHNNNNYCEDSLDNFGFEPLEADANVFVRPMYSPKEFTEIKKRIDSLCSPCQFTTKQKHLQSLKVDELDFYSTKDSGDALKKISKMKTPEHRYYPFIQFNRK